MTERGDRVRVTLRTGSVRRFVGDLKKVKVLEAWHQTRRFDFCELAEMNLRAVGAAGDRGQINKMGLRVCVSPPYVDTFNSKLIKRFRTWTRNRYVFSDFEIPVFFVCSIVMNIICPFCTWLYLALIVNMVHTDS